MNKYVYLFNEGNKDMKELLGGKGANLAEMTSIGLPVPQGFTVTTEACNLYYQNNMNLSNEIINEIYSKIEELEKITGKKLGDKTNPLLLSIRSGARVSMPGMMDTILNIGLNDEVAASFSKATDKRFVYDSYRRLIEMYADVVKGYPREIFENILNSVKTKRKIKLDTELTAEDLENVTHFYKKAYQEISGSEFPNDPKVQIIEAVTAVFKSWNCNRAQYYRKMNDIPEFWGTAVNVQEMVYGNRGENSGTGVAFTRNPATGEAKLYGEYLINAQGEDVVAGIRTPENITTLESIMPESYQELMHYANILEEHYKDMQDMEFTIEDGKLYMLQTRNGKRTANAAIKIAVDLVREGKITEQEAIMMVEPKQLDALLHPTFDPDVLTKSEEIASGLAASPGAASGKIYFDVTSLINAAKKGESAILVRNETSPEDIEGMNNAKGILTVRGGMTSHAAVVARGMGLCCVAGATEITVDIDNRLMKTREKTYHEGDIISLDGSTGLVYNGAIPMIDASISGDFETFMTWVDKSRRLKVRANADNERDALIAKKFGAEGIGLCRTEHMFFDTKRIFNFRKMIVASSKEEREAALATILPYQREDFIKLFKAMSPNSVTIRYLDPPLHEFLPKTNMEINELAQSLNIPFAVLKKRIEDLHEFNPMMGHRGSRLLITYPEIAIMQTRAVIEAAIIVSHDGYKVTPEIMIPLTCDVRELRYIKNIIIKTAEEVLKINNWNLKYNVGTMIEVPRACITADKIAEEAEFFSFGTNDLTQMSYGFSRDDAGVFLQDYYAKNIFTNDVFASLDTEGVGSLIKIAIAKSKQIRPNIELGICGEHAGDAKSIAFCEEIGLDYISSSPYRVPIARLAAAQAFIKANQAK